jgi:hypothetical protein
MEEKPKENTIDLYYLYLQRFYNLNRRLLFSECGFNISDLNEYLKQLDEVRKMINLKEYIRIYKE